MVVEVGTTLDAGDRASVMAEAADHYYVSAELYEDEDLDPQDHSAVIRRAFANSDCDDFASVLNEVTGWPTVRATWTSPDGDVGHHSLVKSGDGRLLDVTGWVTEAQLRKRYRTNRLSVKEVPPWDVQDLDVDDLGFLGTKARIVRVIRVLPHHPFDEDWFTRFSGRDIPGVDAPFADALTP